jgi:hypothetical protein
MRWPTEEEVKRVAVCTIIAGNGGGLFVMVGGRLWMAILLAFALDFYLWRHWK